MNKKSNQPYSGYSGQIIVMVLFILILIFVLAQCTTGGLW